MSLAVVILNYRTAPLTLQALRSLIDCADEAPGLHVYLVDNASGDGSVDVFRDEVRRAGWHERITLIEGPVNLGFAGGNNLALRMILSQDTARFGNVLLLNSDTVVRAGALRHCLARMAAEPDLGVLSCALESADGSLQATARRLPTPLRMTAHVLGLEYRFPEAFEFADLEDRSWDRREARDVEWVGGAFMLVRTSVLRQVGVLDEGFFFYGEDAEFCARVRRAGYRIAYDGTVRIVHLGGGSSDPQRLASRARDRLTWESRYLLQHRCHGRVAEAYLRALDIVTYAARTVRLRFLPTRRTDYFTHRDILSLLLTFPQAGRRTPPMPRVTATPTWQTVLHGRGHV